MTLSVLSVASEAVPLIKTGGLADVAGALPSAVAPHGVAVTTFVPGYPAVMAVIGKAKAVHSYDSLLGQAARIVESKLDVPEAAFARLMPPEYTEDEPCQAARDRSDVSYHRPPVPRRPATD